MQAPAIRAFFDAPTNTVSYLVWDPATKDAAVIDPVLDWDNRSGEADKNDAGLAAPLLLLPSIQVNIRAGRLPRAESNGVSYLKLPMRLDSTE